MQKVLFIGKIWPEPQSSAAGTRTLQIIELFLEQNYQVSFASTAAIQPYSYRLENDGVLTQQIKLNDASFINYINSLQPDVVVFDRFMTEEQFGWQVRETCPDATTILDTQDLHFLREARAVAKKKKSKINLHTPLAKREIASILKCDLTLLIATKERELLIESFKIPAHILLYIPFLENIDKIHSIQLKPFSERKHFAFIGNFLHEPNYQTVLQLKKEIWPRLSKELPHAEMHIYGAYTSQKVEQLQNIKERFHIKGRAKKAVDTLENYKVLLAPIPFGAGIKGKFVDAMKSGTPSVTTNIGAESMRLDNVWNGFVSDDNEDFIQKAKSLYENVALWKEAQTNGFKLFSQSFDKTNFTPIFWRKIYQIKENISQHRKANFIGEILKTNQFNSQKYMSKWIEAKNLNHITKKSP